jgi:hypothetical protein
MLIGYVPYTRSGSEVLVIHLHLIYPIASINQLFGPTYIGVVTIE